MRWLVWSLASPSQVIAATVIAGGALVAIGRGRGRLARLLLVTGAGGLLLFGCLPAAHYLAYPLEQRFPATPLPDDVAGIILIGGGERVATSEAYGEPQLNAHGSRYVAALRLAARYPRAQLVSTAGPMVKPGKGPLGTHSAVAAAILDHVAPKPERLRYDTSSRDTCDHPANTRDLVQPRPDETWVVVTSAMHMPRVMACFRAAGWGDVVPYPTDYRVVMGRLGPGSFQMAANLALLDFAVHEWVGLVYYRVTGRTGEIFPAPGLASATGAPAIDPPGAPP